MDTALLLSHGIDPENCLNFEVISDEKETLIFVKLKPNQRNCIYCHNENTNIKEYKIKKIKSLPTGKNLTIISFYLPRYHCKNCGKTYTHNLKPISDKSLSKVLKEKIIKRFSTITTFKSIGQEFDLSLTEVINIFDEVCPDLRIPITEAICIDEFSNIRNSDYKYACLLIDFLSHKIIDIIPSRTTPYLDTYFAKIPLKIRNNVKYIITDMYDGYISAAKRWFKNVVIAIDPFHYMKYITEAVQKIRRRILCDESKYFKDRAWMGTNWRLLTTNPKNFPSRNMVLKSGITISYRDRVLRFVKQDSELIYAFLMLQNIYTELNNLTFSKASSYFNFIINTLKNSTIPEFIECGKTWDHYKEYIINSFIVYKNKGLSNGAIEGVNKRVKELKNIMSGYRNTNRFYKRIVLVQNNKKR